MAYTLKPTNFFLEQLDDISDEAAELIEKKLKLVKINPFRNKRIKGYKIFLFRIRFKDRRKEKRVVYALDREYIKVLCILDRDKDYKDMKKYLKRLGYL